ncbi:electron transport complex subunit RsxE [Candidatus Methylocalor cossyra]|uniref:SoxR [2Fe-2S] reducing system protein RsxE n=1 Tax=Candidatus Methylocalor cossyra TaxID=3108543 RepID=A0ABM9NG07_9GAMM
MTTPSPGPPVPPGPATLLGLCPLLAVSTTLIQGLGLGVATALTLVLSNLAISLFRPLIAQDVRLPLFALIIAAIVTLLELGLRVWFGDLYRTLGLFIPLMVSNCLFLGWTETHASRHRPDRAVIDGLRAGLGFAAVLTLLGALREAVGAGTLLRDAELLFGPGARHWTLHLQPGLRLAILPPGAFLGLGLLVAGNNLLIARRRRNHPSEPGTPSFIRTSRPDPVP